MTTAAWFATFAGVVGQPLPAQAVPPVPAAVGVIEAVPGPAMNPRVTATAAGSADLAWDTANWGANNTHHYTVLLNDAPFAGCTDIAALTCHVTGPANGAAVALKVRALGDDPAENTDSAAVTTTLLPPPDVPGTVTAAASGSQQAIVQWTAPPSWHLSTNRKYTVLVDGVVFSGCQNLASTTTSCTFTGSAGARSVVVRAVGNTGLSADAAPVSVTLVTAPGQPTDIHLTASNAGTGTVAWTAPDWLGNTNQKYNVTVTAGGVATQVCTNISATSCAFEADDITVQVVVTAIGDSPNLTRDSAPVTLTLLPAPGLPTNVHATTWGVGTATVAWTAPSFNGSGNNTYTVLVGGTAVPSCTNISATQCVITGTADSTASVVVRAIGDVGLSADSTPAAIIDLPALPDAVTNVHVTARALNSTRVDWDAPTSWHNNTNHKYVVSVSGASGAVGCGTPTTNTYCVIAGGSDNTASVTVTAVGNTPALSKDTTASVELPGVPDAPTNVHATATAAGSADIAWTEPNWHHNTNRTYAVTASGGATAVCGSPSVATCHLTGTTSTDVTVRAIGDDPATLTSAASAPATISLIAAPTGAVGTVTVTVTHGNQHVVVDWASTLTDNGGSWSGGTTTNYAVAITKPSGATLTNNSCGSPVADPTLTCSFDTDLGGTYTAAVTAVNEAGPSSTPTTGSATLVRFPPVGQVSNLGGTDAPGTGNVHVVWDALPTASWNGASTKTYQVTIDPPSAATITGTCTATVTAPTSACDFHTDVAGVHTIRVRPGNEAGADTTETTATVTVALVAPSAAVTGLTVTPATTGVVTVAWTGIAAAAWQGATHHYNVVITKPSGAVLSSNSCTALATTDATTATGCSFTADTAGDYGVTVTAVNEVGPGADTGPVSGHVTLQAPLGPISGITVTPTVGSGVVNVTWTQLADASWRSAVTRNYTVTVTSPTGAALSPNTCTTVTDSSTPSCSFTTDTAGDYQVGVVATSEAGSSAAGTAVPGHVTLVVPTGTVTGIVVDNTAGSRVVNLRWDALTTGWSSGQTLSYAVTVTVPTTATTCTSVAVGVSQPSCSFTTTDPGPFSVTVKAVNEVGPAASGTTATGHVSLQPTASVTGLTATAAPGSPTVAVAWTQLGTPSWLGGTSKAYQVTVDTPGGSAVLTANTCTLTTVADSATPGCSFTADLSGDYIVRVKPVNEAGISTGTATPVTAHIALQPTAVVSGLRVLTTPGSPYVDVRWGRAPTAAWNGGTTTRNYVVTVTGPTGSTITDSDCTIVADATARACSFTGDRGGVYTATVALATEAGTSNNTATANATLVLDRPSGQVGAVTVATAANSGTVTVSWPQLTDAAWSFGQTRSYAVTIGGGLSLTGNTCVSVPDSAQPSCSFTTTSTGSFTVTVKAVNEAGTATVGTVASGNLVATPTAAVSGLTATATLGSPTVNVTWTQFADANWRGGTQKKYLVTVTNPTGIAISADTCTPATVSDSSSPGCTFTVGAGGAYVVHVAAVNEAGTGPVVDSTAQVVLAPVGSVGTVVVTNPANSQTVNLSWPRLPDAGWNAGTTRRYVVTITGLTAATSTCASVLDGPNPACSFTTTNTGSFTVSVKAVNEAGTAVAESTGSGYVRLTPTASVSGLTAANTPGSPTVAVSWNQLAGSAWLGGTTKQYVVTVDKPDGSSLTADSCTTAVVVDSATPGCTFTASIGGAYVVHVAPQNEVGSGAVASATATVKLRPTATVPTVTVTTSAGSPEVTVTWSPLGGTGWNGGTTHTYVVTLGTTGGATVAPNTCVVVTAPTTSCTFTTDRPGTYTAQVAAANEIGTALTGTSGTGVVGSAAPAAASAVTGVGGVNTISASWTSPTSNLLAAVTSYTVTASADGYPTRSCPDPVTTAPCTISQVAAGVSYDVHVVANGPGGSSSSATSTVPVVPTGLVATPTQVPDPDDVVSAGSGTTGSTTTGGSITITGSGYAPGSRVVIALYTVPVVLGEAIADANGNITFTGSLPSGTPVGGHTLLATGLDPNGEVLFVGKALTVSAVPPPVVVNPPVVTPPTSTAPTGAVTSLTARQTPAQVRTATVSWAAGPVAWGSGSVHGYRVTVTGPDTEVTGSCATEVPATVRSCTFAADTDGTYTVTVTATTEAGTSGQTASTSVVLSGAPGMPTGVKAAAGANSMVVSWNKPATAGVTGYTVTATAPYYPIRGCVTPVTKSPCTISGLAAGVRYVARVVAVGSGGTSASAAATVATQPTGTVLAPQTVPASVVGAGSQAAKAGAKVTISGTGYRAKTPVLLRFYPGGASLGSSTTSAKGALSATVTIPAGTQGGRYTVLATGLDDSGRARYLGKAITVPGVAGVSVKGFTGTGTPTVASGGGGTTKVAATGTDLATTGPDGNPLLLAGFVLVATGLVLATTVGRRRRSSRR